MDTENIINALGEMGGKRWQKAGRDRIYFNSGRVLELAGLDYATYKTGRISGATFRTANISNADCSRMIGTMSSFNFWFDLTDGKWYVQGNLDASSARWVADGEDFVTPRSIWKTARGKLDEAIRPFLK